MDCSISSKNREEILIRQNGTLPIKTLFLIGNGAIENGNTPLEQALEEAQQHGLFQFRANDIGCTSALACLSLNERHLFDSIILYLKGALTSLPSPLIGVSGFHFYLEQLYGRTIAFREILAKHFRDMGDSLRIRSSVEIHLENLGLFEPDSACVTTNWDGTIWNNNRIKNVLHMHGRCSHPWSLILPTETIVERTLKWQLLNEVKEKLYTEETNATIIKIADDIFKYYEIDSSLSINTQLFEIENIISNWSNSIEKIVIAGMRFNDYDHELMTMLSRTQLQDKAPITLINRAEFVKEKESKIKKVAGLFSCLRYKVEFINTSTCQSF